MAHHSTCAFVPPCKLSPLYEGAVPLACLTWWQREKMRFALPLFSRAPPLALCATQVIWLFFAYSANSVRVATCSFA